MSKRLFLPIFLSSLLIFIYCDGGDGPTHSNNPSLSDLELTASIHYADSQTVSVLVTDPQGLGDIDSVFGNYMVPGNTGSVRYIQLHDNGIGGDATPADGRFTSRFLPGGGFLLDDYAISIGATDLSGNFAEQIDSSFSVVDTSTPLNPVLSDVELELYHFYRDSQTVSVAVADPNGPEDIDSVWGRYYYDEASPDYADILFNDDGLNGDMTPDDNRYTAMFLPDSGAFIQGIYRINISAADLGGLQSAQYDTLFVSADSATLTWPVLFDPELDDIHNYSDSQTVSVFVDDPQGYGNIDSVWGQWFFVDNPVPVNHLPLYDDGTHGDQNSGDGRFTATFIADTGVFDIGLHYLSLFAADIDGHQSQQYDTTFTTVGNPTLSNIVAPDSLQKGSPDTSYIYIDAYDPDGLSDIDSVYFVVTRPDGTSNGTHFYMRDDGVAGDVTAGDGTYTLGILAPDPANQSGDYIFRFYAMDMDGNYSNIPQTIITAY
jgi:hypothetical protein